MSVVWLKAIAPFKTDQFVVFHSYNKASSYSLAWSAPKVDATVLKKVSPNRFEMIVLNVLHRLGYGAGRNDLQRVGGSGDSGIDGIISLDKLGSREGLCPSQALAEHRRPPWPTGFLRCTRRVLGRDCCGYRR
ncbi:restriction endonuclease [Pseudomonas arsenicoxydans]|nr:restriction endonuclease [Pseudomonas arsenicoxydans]